MYKDVDSGSFWFDRHYGITVLTNFFLFFLFYVILNKLSKYMLIAVVTKKDNLKKLTYAIRTLICNTMSLTVLLWSVNATVRAVGSLFHSVLSS